MSHPAPKTSSAEPAWEIARLFPLQGAWSVEEYLDLKGNHLVEFSDGSIEVLPMPTTSHQLIVVYLYRLLFAWVSARNAGVAAVAPLRVRLWEWKLREPDLVFMSAAHRERAGEEFWDGADLVMEVVSDEGRRRDLEIKRVEYARAGIPEYWIVDPKENRITVLRLEGDDYAIHGQFAPGQSATSVLLTGFAVDVAAAFESARPA